MPARSNRPASSKLSAVVRTRTSFKLPKGFLGTDFAYSRKITAVSAEGDRLDAPVFQQLPAGVCVGCDFGLFRR